MDKLLTADDVAGILRVSRRTAYSYMSQMIHMERPLRVTETSLRQWISGRTVDPEARYRNAPGKRGTRNKTTEKDAHGMGRQRRDHGGSAEMPGLPEYHIPRRREKEGVNA